MPLTLTEAVNALPGKTLKRMGTLAAGTSSYHIEYFALPAVVQVAWVPISARAPARSGRSRRGRPRMPHRSLSTSRSSPSAEPSCPKRSQSSWGSSEPEEPEEPEESEESEESSTWSRRVA